MRVHIATLLFASALAFEGCTTHVPAVEPTDLTKIQEVAATRADVEAILGEPEETLQTKIGVIHIYSYDGGAIRTTERVGGCYGAGCLLYPLLWWIAIPLSHGEKVAKQRRYVAVIYSAEDKASFYAWGSQVSSPEYIRRRIDSEIERDRKAKDLERRATNGDAEAQWEMATATSGGEAENWICLAAQNGHAKAQHRMGEFYHYGIGKFGVDAVRAYVWLRLSENNGYEGPQGWGLYTRTVDGGYACCSEEKEPRMSELELVANSMTREQISEAEMLVAEWLPNPSECGAEPTTSLD